MLEGTKLDSPLISALVERWRLDTHTFHLPYGECTITLEDVSLQPGLSINRDGVTGSVVSVDWSATYDQLLGKVLNKFRGSQIEMRWLDDNFQTIKDLEIDVEKEQFTHAFILKLIRVRMDTISGSEDLKMHLGLILANLSIWHVKVPLIIFAMVDMHESEQVMRQFKCMQRTPLQPQKLDGLHKIDM
ncbi:hypothetical protein CXB51_025994 [Gossypium anomalum]|uniref:Aminotransferase-like plant mobile domain-containing protein n=1 Tax=Gossypium anomalum TaxID=47600 RepID=A0A8J5YAX7_9ROSI|nr:hypothetical protein CXB51_025994 [Gossypium anomalum]